MLRKFAYRFYRFTSSIRHWAGGKFTPAGALVAAALVISALTGMDTNRTMAYQVFSFLFFIAAVSVVSGWRFRARFAVKRALPRFATAGEPVSYNLTVMNRTEKEQRGLSVIEEIADPRPSFDEFVNIEEPGEERRNRFDRYFGYYRWRWIITLRKTAETKERPLDAAPPGGESQVKMTLTPVRRGYTRLRGVSVTRLDIFGLFKSKVSVPAEAPLLVLPKRYRTSPLSMPGARKYHHGGVAMASHVGDSEEFVSLRDYRPGDPMRSIHWRSWARTGTPVVKEFQEEFFTRHGLILDTFTKTGGSELFEEAVSVAASFVANLDTHEALLDLMFIGTEAYLFTTGRSLASADGMLEILASVTACTDKPFGALQDAVIERLDVLSGCVLILLAWDTQRRELVKRLRAAGAPLLVLVMADKGVEHEPGPMRDDPGAFHVLTAGAVEEGLARI